MGSPEQIGDQIPNGTPHGTTIDNINLIEDGRSVKGYVYGATDGHEYFQRTTTGSWSGAGSAGLGPVSGSATEPAQSDIHRFELGDVKPGEHFVPMDAHSAPLDKRLGFDPERELALRPGQSTTGSVLAVTDDGKVIQKAGRGSYYVHDGSSFKPMPHVGDNVSVSMQQSGQSVGQVNAAASSPELGLGRAG
jgi:hypothetical protein